MDSLRWDPHPKA